MNEQEKKVVSDFHQLYYFGPHGELRLYDQAYWMGRQCLKCPLDLWMYQEIIFEVQPDLIIETGSYPGGTALFLANILDMIGRGKIVSFDVLQGQLPKHKRITYVTGSSADEKLVEKSLRKKKKDVCMVILDSAHDKKHVLAEMKLFAPYVSMGSYLIVEDTNINGNPVMAFMTDGPKQAIEAFMAGNDEFVVDASRERYLLTFNPGGYLKRVKECVR